MSRLIRTQLSTEPVRIGEARGDQGLLSKAAEILARDYPDIRTELAAEGFRFIPLKETVKFHEAMIAQSEAGRRKGYADGKAVGFAEGRREAEKVYADLAGVIRDIRAQRENILRDAEARVVDLIVRVARKITFDAAQVDPELTSEVVKGAIGYLLDKRQIKVRLHPDHLPIVREHLTELQSLSSEIKEITLEADPRCSYGGCFIETPSGDLDARIDSQFAVIEKALRDAVTTP